MTRKDLIISILIILCITVAAFPNIASQPQTENTTASAGEYDPWIDTNDDGTINYKDLFNLASLYGTSGTPINKTDLLLELDTRVSALEAVKVVAAGFIVTNGTPTESYNIKSSTWDAVAGHYEIHLAGIYYEFSGCVTIVTGVGSYAKHATTGSKFGNLIVYLFNDAGDKVQGNFQFVIYEIY